MTRWIHSRKGEIEGEVVKDEGDFVSIQLTAEATLKWRSEDRRGSINEVGEILTVRKSFLKEVT